MEGHPVKIPPLAQELNAVLENEANPVLAMLSQIGKRFYFPKGIISQSAEAKAKGHRFNATIGIATESGGPMHLGALMKYFQGLEPKDLFPYAPPGGKPELRKIWNEKQLRENPSLVGKKTGQPIVTAALTHGLSLLSELFIDPGDKILLPDKLWGNYRLTFEVRQGGEVVTFPFFADGGFNRAGFAAALDNLATSERKVIVMLNFPNNPTGFSPTLEDAQAITAAIVAAAEKGLQQVVVCDDAYFGLFYDDVALKESIFGLLAGVHPNVLAVKLDGATKEEFAWGFRTGFLTFAAGGDGDLDAVHTALEKKTLGLIRGGVSNCPHPSQSAVLAALRDPEFPGQQAQKREILRQRATRVHEVLRQEKFAKAWTPYPFNSGYFMCVRLNSVEAEPLRLHLLDKYGVGVISTGKSDIRVAFSCLEVGQIEDLFDDLLKAWEDLA
jgi:aspartate/methionine/tyrosine aminotransferase